MEKCSGLGRLLELRGNPAPYHPAVPFGFKEKLRPGAALPEVAESTEGRDPIMISAAIPLNPPGERARPWARP